MKSGLLYRDIKNFIRWRLEGIPPAGRRLRCGIIGIWLLPEREGRRKKRFEAAGNMQPADLPTAWTWERRKEGRNPDSTHQTSNIEITKQRKEAGGKEAGGRKEPDFGRNSD